MTPGSWYLTGSIYSYLRSVPSVVGLRGTPLGLPCALSPDLSSPSWFLPGLPQQWCTRTKWREPESWKTLGSLSGTILPTPVQDLCKQQTSWQAKSDLAHLVRCGLLPSLQNGPPTTTPHHCLLVLVVCAGPPHSEASLNGACSLTQDITINFVNSDLRVDKEPFFCCQRSQASSLSHLVSLYPSPIQAWPSPVPPSLHHRSQVFPLPGFLWSLCQSQVLHPPAGVLTRPRHPTF